MRKVLSLLILILAIGGSAASSVLAAPATCTGGFVALTFDDGPTLETSAVLDALKLYGMKATFFVLGEKVEQYPDIARRIVTEGHAIGNHSWNHPDLTTVTEAELDYQLRSTNAKILQVTGITPKFARPPYGSTNETVRKAMAINGLREVIWSQDSWDWTFDSTLEDVFNQLTLVPPGGTFLMHDWTENALAVIPAIHW